MMPIQRQSDHYLGTADHGGCHACGDQGPLESHHRLGSRLCAECYAVADTLSEYKQAGVPITPGMFG